MAQEKRPCNICGRPETGDRQLCGKHWRAYQERDKTLYATKAQFVEAQRKQLEIELDDEAKAFTSKTITKENAEEMKLIAQANKEREMYLRHLRQNRREAGELVSKSESTKASFLLLSAILKELETMTDVLPPILEHRSAGEIRPLLVEQNDSMFSAIREKLNELRE